MIMLFGIIGQMRREIIDIISTCYFNIMISSCILGIVLYFWMGKKHSTNNASKVWVCVIKWLTRVILFFCLFTAYFSIKLIFEKAEWVFIPFDIPCALEEIIRELRRFFHIVKYRGMIVFYFVTLLSFPIIILLMGVDFKNEMTWYVYFNGFSLLICMIFIIIFTDSFIVVCIGHLLICYFLFYLLDGYGKIDIPDIIWIYFWIGALLVGIGTIGLYLATGNFVWIMTDGLRLTDQVRYILQCCFYIGFSFPLGLCPVYGRALGSCKALPYSFLIFFNCVFPVYYIFLLTCVHSVLGGTASNYILLLFIILTISILTYELAFEVDFKVIVGYMSLIQLHLLVFSYLFDSIMIRYGLVYDIWVHIWCITSLYISLSRFSRCYGECITTAHEGLFYKYPGTTLLNIISLGWFIKFAVIFIYTICYQSYWTLENFLLLSLFVPVVSSLIIYLVIILCQWSCLWFKVPKHPDNHIPQEFTWEECACIVYLLLIVIVLFFYPVLFYW